jgi:hypothetical protein
MRKRCVVRVRYLVASVFGLLCASPVWGTPADGSPFRDLTKVFDYSSYFDANQLLMFTTNVGSFAYDQTNLFSRSDGLYFPRGTSKTTMYASGLWVGAKVNGQTRVTVSEYSSEYVPGRLGADPSDGRFHVYKIHRGDSPTSNLDYAMWPFDDGAPALKAADGTDSLDATGNRIPLLIGDQTLWSVFNDGDPSTHTNNCGETDPLDIEVRNLAFGFMNPSVLGRVAFMQWTITNAGPLPITDAYVSFWADPDVGNSRDDLAGCDPALSLGYAYNDGPDDEYGPIPPAVGFVLLQGPMVPAMDFDTAYAFGQAFPGRRNLPMTAFTKYIIGTDPKNATETYNHMRGLNPGGTPIRDPWGNLTTYMLSGDPVSGAGWVDWYPDDCRYMVSTGPFNLAPGDSQEVMIAVCVGQGGDALTAVTDLRATAREANNAYDVRFDFPHVMPAPPVVLDIVPGQCPNALIAVPTPRTGSLGKGSPLFPVADDPFNCAVTFAVCGTPDLDVHDLDPGTLTLAGVPATNVRFRDVTSPGAPESPCDCTRGGLDGIVDLVAEVDQMRLHDALDSPPVGEQVEVHLGGRLKDGRSVQSVDCISVQKVRVADIDFNIVETAGPGGVPVSPPNNVADSLNSTGDWYVSSGLRGNFRFLDWLVQSTAGETWEIKFNSDGSEYYDFYEQTKAPDRAPFAVWNLGIGTPDDPSDDRRVQFQFFDLDHSGRWSMGDPIYVVEVEYTEPLPPVFAFADHWPLDYHVGDILFTDYSGNGRPVDGTVVRFTAKEVYVEPKSVTPSLDVKRTVARETTARTRLDANYPNPFNAATTISYNLDSECHVTLEVFNVLGERTATLVDGEQTAGAHDVTWTGKDAWGDEVASGMYFYRLRTGNAVLSRKMVLLK